MFGVSSDVACRRQGMKWCWMLRNRMEQVSDVRWSHHHGAQERGWKPGMFAIVMDYECPITPAPPFRVVVGHFAGASAPSCRPGRLGSLLLPRVPGRARKCCPRCRCSRRVGRGTGKTVEAQQMVAWFCLAPKKAAWLETKCP